MAVNKVIYGNDTIIDLTGDTATEADVVSGKSFHLKSGVQAVGTATIPEPATATPLMDGTAAVGTATKYAREDHKHPSDTAKVSKSGDTMTGGLTLQANLYYESNNKNGLNANNSDIIGLNGLYTADACDGAGEGINFYRDSTHYDTFRCYNGKAQLIPYRPKSSTSGDAGIQDLYAMPNYGNGTTDISVRPLIAYARANRFAFLPAEQIIIEKTTDGGTTWQDAGVSDATKKALFATRGASVSIPLLNNAKSTSCGVRITITAMKYAVPSGTAETGKYAYWNSTYVTAQERYSNLREMWFWLSANNDTIRVQVYSATGASPDNWVSIFDTNFGLTGWSGSDWIRLGGQTFGGGTTQTGNYWNWRIVFWSRMKDGASEFASSTAQVINGIQGHGDSVWGIPNGMMKEDHLYTWDVNQNALFPANVTATQFNGNLNGNATTATTATKVSAVAGFTNADRHVWFSDSAYEVNRNYDDDFKYNPSTNTLTVSNVTGNAATATTATKATQDESGNNIKASYGASLDISGTTLSLKNKNGTALNSVTIPSELPAVTSSDNGKVLTVVSGAWEAATGGGSSPSPATANPLMDGTAAVGTSVKYAREDHVHPSDTNKQDTISDLTTIRSNATDGETAYTRSTNKVLYYTSVAVSVGTGDIATVSNAAITADHVVTSAVFADPSKITSQVTWTTAAGSLTLNGTCSSATTANIVLIKKDN